jgi:hypothetical protein
MGERKYCSVNAPNSEDGQEHRLRADIVPVLTLLALHLLVATADTSVGSALHAWKAVRHIWKAWIVFSRIPVLRSVGGDKQAGLADVASLAHEVSRIIDVQIIPSGINLPAALCWTLRIRASFPNVKFPQSVDAFPHSSGTCPSSVTRTTHQASGKCIHGALWLVGQFHILLLGYAHKTCLATAIGKQPGT